MFNLENSKAFKQNYKMFNIMKIDGENWVVSHEDLMNPGFDLFQNCTVEYVGTVNIPNKYLEKQQPVEPNNEVFELH